MLLSIELVPLAEVSLTVPLFGVAVPEALPLMVALPVEPELSPFFGRLPAVVEFTSPDVVAAAPPTVPGAVALAEEPAVMLESVPLVLLDGLAAADVPLLWYEEEVVGSVVCFLAFASLAKAEPLATTKTAEKKRGASLVMLLPSRNIRGWMRWGM
jgi:hypothetical protein